MPLFKNRIGLSLLVIGLGIGLWEFYFKPVSGPIYAAAVSEYRNHNYERSLKLLHRAYKIDPNNTSILTLMGWDYLKTRNPRQALQKFSRAYRLAPHTSDTILGYADTEINLERYRQASKLLRLLGNDRTDSADLDMAWGTLFQLTGRDREAARKFERVLALRHNDMLALENLQQLYGQKAPASASSPRRVGR